MAKKPENVFVIAALYMSNSVKANYGYRTTLSEGICQYV